MPAEPVSSPSRSDILGSPLPALPTATGQIQEQLRSPSNESAQSDAAAANTNATDATGSEKQHEVVRHAVQMHIIHIAKKVQVVNDKRGVLLYL